MSDGTKIEWTDATWNPLRAWRTVQQPDGEFVNMGGWHCERVSPGCQNCYAETLNEKRFGTGLPYTRVSREKVSIEVDEAALAKPLHWRKARRVFVCSMTDLFGEWVSDEQIDRVFAVMALAPRHTFQVLSKRPERMRAYLSAEHRQAAVEEDADIAFGAAVAVWPLPNVWLGVSAEDQQRWEERVPELLATPAAVRFVSAEPLLGPINATVSRFWLTPDPEWPGDTIFNSRKLDWVIVGGESGPGARPCDVGWIRSLVDECRSASIPAFVKQLGAKPYGRIGTGVAAAGIRGRRPDAAVPELGMVNWAPRLKDPKGGDMDEWAVDLRVREFPR